jgi:hypothetical protein
MTQKERELQAFIDNITLMKNDNYEEFIRIKYMIDGVLLSKKVSNESHEVN